MEVGERHRTVLLDDAVEALALQPSSTVVDATGGGGGHSEKILQTLNSQGTLFVFESDPDMVAKLRARLGTPPSTLHIISDNFRNVGNRLAEYGVTKIDALLADLGWNSEQFVEGGRGFSFQKDEPLLMTYGDPENAPFTAADVVNTWSEASIADALYAYADERYARRIARAIVEARKETPITTTTMLADVVSKAVPGVYRRGRIHPATKTFQALRIAVNDELDALRELIDSALALLTPQGRMAIITFHSIEDRLVKEMFREYEKSKQGTVVTKKPLIPSEHEMKSNPRSRSAKLRIFSKA